MAKKKKGPAFATSQQDTALAREVLGRYHQIAANLRKSTSRSQAVEALEEINRLPEAAQVALAKALAQEQHTDAADMLAGINELSSQKGTRKEAKRSLIQLEGQRVYPNWKPPVEEHAFSMVPTGSPLRRFWKGMMSDTLDIGQIQLVLAWEQGAGYRRVLAFIFMIDFQGGGVEELVVMQDERKDDFEATAAQVAKSLGSPFKSCSLAQGRSLLKKALEVSKQTGTKLPAEYRRNLPLITQLVLEAPGVEDEEVDLDFLEDDDDLEEGPDLSDLPPTEVVTSFVEFWVNSDFDIAYRLLASDSPLREGLSEEEWDEKRASWADDNDPGELLPDFAEEREAPRSKLWLPRGMSGKGNEEVKVVEAGWSIELYEETGEEEEEEAEEEAPDEESEEAAPAVETLPEVPTASTVFHESGRHWFWASYTLVKDQGEWRIQSITDEVAQLRNLSTVDLLAKVDESHKELDKLIGRGPNPRKKQFSEKEGIDYLTGVMYALLRLSFYLDALIARGATVDNELVQDVAVLLILLGMRERALNYLDFVAQHSEELRVANLRLMADTRRVLSRQYEENDYEERAERFREKAEQELKELLAIKDDASTHISLVEVYLDGERLDEAEEHLLLAKSMTDDAADQAHIEMHLGEIAMERELYEEATGHYQRVVDLQPDQASSWADLARAYAGLGNTQQAESFFRHAIDLDPENVDLYYGLRDMYLESGQAERAAEVLEEGLDRNPDSEELTLTLATFYLERGDYEQAELYMERLANLNPDYEMLPLMRQTLAILRSNPMPGAGKPRLMPAPPRLPGPPKKQH